MDSGTPIHQNFEPDKDVLISTKIATQLIEKQKNFKASVETPKPSSMTRNEYDDIAAVIAGVKNAASSSDIYSEKNKELLIGLMYEARKKGLTWKMHMYEEIPIAVVGQEKDVNRIIQIQQGPKDVHTTQELGRLYGYPQEAIDSFIKKPRK